MARVGWMEWVMLASVALSGSACSSSSGGDGDGSAPVQACKDTAHAWASSAERCGKDYQVNYDVFVTNAANGSCDNIIQVRDSQALYDVCIPFLANLTCTQMEDPNLSLPPECQSQLIRP